MSDVIAPDIHPLADNRKFPWRRPASSPLRPRYQVPAHHKNPANLPPSIDLTPEMPRVYDQGQLGACTGNALAGLYQFLLMKEGLPSFVPSRLMIYWGERQIEGDVSQDSGANGDDGMTFLANKGVCPESLWPYDVAQFAVEPPKAAWASAYHHKIGGAVTIADGDMLGVRSCLASGYPIAFGFTAFAGLQSDAAAKTGIIPLPAKGEQPIGGHEVVLVGYDDSARTFKIRNSWSSSWGDKGYGYMSYDYIGDKTLAGDFRSATHAA